MRELLPLLSTSLPTNVIVELDIDATEARVIADRSQLEQVILNLVLNARDAMPDGGRLRVSVSVNAMDGHSLLTVTDTGTGMDDATLARIFEPFFTTKALGSGTGLGLSVVYGVITQAGGSVRVESAPGHGTTMHITLPLSTAALGERPEPLGAETHADHRVLLVDDDEAVRTTTKRLLERNGWRVLEANEGEMALAMFVANRRDIDVVLTDVRMPVMDGVELARQVRHIANDFPIIFFSGYDELEQHVVDGIANVPLIAKPFSVRELLAALDGALASR